MASLETSLEANSDRMTEKATYRGSSYRSAQKYFDFGGDAPTVSQNERMYTIGEDAPRM